MKTVHARRLARRPWLLAAAALLLVSGCTELREAMGDEVTPTSEATSVAETTIADDATPTVADESAVRYIGNTGGLGVSLRSDCATDARIVGGWAEATEVLLVERGDGRCEGWSRAEADGASSWVSEIYLLDQDPAAITAGSPAAPPASSAGSAGSSGGATSAAPTPPAPTSTPSSAPPAAGAAPMIVYGPAAAGASVLILVDGRPCKTVSAVVEPASATGFLWSTQVNAGECNAHIGSALTFALNGAPTNEQLEWSAGGVPADASTGVTLTLR